MKRLTIREFIKKARRKHGNKFDYSKATYINNSTKVKIVCGYHGIFTQRPADHMRGDGCPSCKFEKLATQKRSNKKEFIQKAKNIHGNSYNYTKVQYKNAITKVKIICKIHGVFLQTPDKHLGGCGCVKCSNTTSRGERRIQQILDTLNIKYEREKRFSDLHGTTKNSRLKYDFWLPDYNTLIEYDGEHHFSAVQIKGRLTKTQSLTRYKATVVNDNKKNRYAKKYNFRLIRIPFTKLEELTTTYFQLALAQQHPSKVV